MEGMRRNAAGVNKHKHVQVTQQVPYLAIASGELPAKIAGILRELRELLPQMNPKAISWRL
jgi:hypothetical protein